MTDILHKKHAALREILRRLESVAVAFSGGVDSALVLKVALDVLGHTKVIAVTGRSDSVAIGELDDATSVAAGLGAKHVIIDTDEFSNPNYISNPVNRCYFCKTTLYGRLAEFIAAHELRAVVNGVNADDLGDYRPGLTAAGEHGVVAPLADAGLTKPEVRELARCLGIPIFDKPASPCLSSRVPYGEAVTPEKLRMIEAAEVFLRGLGLRECRVRHHGTLARIEVPAADISRLAEPQTRARVDACLRSLGYQYVSLDLRGFRSGSLNEPLLVQLDVSHV